MNSGIYAFDGDLLADAVKRVSTDNAQGEEYLTDVLSILRGRTATASARTSPPTTSRSRASTTACSSPSPGKVLNRRLLERAHARRGHDRSTPASTWIDVDVTLEPDAVIHPGTQLHGRTERRGGRRGRPGHHADRHRASARARWCATPSASSAEIGPQASVGPYAYLRPGTVLGRKAKAGTFVEMKNAQVGEGSKVPHLTYVGRRHDRRRAPTSAPSAIFVNYDGVDQAPHRGRRRTRSSAATPCSSRPVTIGDGAYTAAGSVIDAMSRPARSGWPGRGSATSKGGSCAGARAPSRPRRPSGRRAENEQRESRT